MSALSPNLVKQYSRKKQYLICILSILLTTVSSSAVMALPVHTPENIELMCDGQYTMMGTKVIDLNINGILITISSQYAKIYNLPASIGDYKNGLRMQISEKNPARIFLESSSDEAVLATINRLNGEISISKHAEPGGRMLEMFSGKCRNAKQIF